MYLPTEADYLSVLDTKNSRNAAALAYLLGSTPANDRPLVAARAAQYNATMAEYVVDVVRTDPLPTLIAQAHLVLVTAAGAIEAEMGHVQTNAKIARIVAGVPRHYAIAELAENTEPSVPTLINTLALVAEDGTAAQIVDAAVAVIIALGEH